MTVSYTHLDVYKRQDLAFGILEENEENADRVLDIQEYVNRQNKKLSLIHI